MFLALIRRVSVIILVTLSLLTNIYFLFTDTQNWNPQIASQNQVSKWERHLQPVRKILPPNIKNVGYLADWDLPDIPYTYEQNYTQNTEYILTQYALAPAIVHRGFEYDWIIGNFSSPNFESWLKTLIGNYKIQNLGFRIYLIQRVEK
jgi:hypothetical protein